ncbi:carbohydrate kinase family protein [Enterococcus columbae]|uniref:Carbohydrate kinase PfkB domain-containing protein n=1 Tax=Enterococcus columbae DSM 7374 = ATCC 51263 TaxID=1121865 RepID=S1P301_9ENTE|nr:PfkB family carbohydrate kinase [Enterococcus columbae]EOT44645.1 hypothetical protein OMW_00701 [Enterococcus columbae DSM 7374 = ATCC 51263]EOW87459.1 hypothetical protein I568_00503 [Enterococcus columbae DSM 7374 = ATCC 51263]
MSKCLVIGSSVCDCFIYTDRLPTREADVQIKAQKMQIGGCAFNVAATLKGLGADFDFLSPVGQGVYGDFVAQELTKQQLPVMRVDGDNGCCYCFIEADGERSFLSYHGVEYRFQPAWLDSYDLASYSYLYLCGLEVEEPTGEALVDSLANFSGKIVFCPGPRVDKIASKRCQKLLSYQPILHLNEQEAYLMSGENELQLAIERLYSWTQSLVIVTLGADGVIAYNGTWLRVSQEKVPVCDTLGAGDSHAAGFLAGVLSGKNLHQSLVFANQVAGEVVQVTGCLLESKTYQKLRRLKTYV